MARAGLGSPLRKLAGRALALAPVAGGVPNTPYPLCVHVCLCVRLCLVPCDLQRSEIYSQCLCACRRGLCVSRCHWRPVPSGMWPPLAACLPSVAHVLLGWVLSRGHCCLSACVRAMSCSCLLCRSSLDERLYRDMCVESCVRCAGARRCSSTSSYATYKVLTVGKVCRPSRTSSLRRRRSRPSQV